MSTMPENRAEARKRLGHMVESIDRYVNDHIPTGGFLYAVLCNDLHGAVSRADAVNTGRLADFVFYLHNYVPHECWGSPEKVRAWLEQEPPK